MTLYRTEHALALFGIEGSWGIRANPTKRFGIHETVSAPDMENEWYPFFGVASGRSRDSILRGRLSFRGGVPDIRLQSTTDIKSLFALILGRVAGTTVSEGLSANDERIPSMTLGLSFRDTDGTYSFMREFYGGKVGRATIRANEGEELRLSLDDIVFKDTYHNQVGVAKYAAWIPATPADPGASGAPRFMFAGASITVAGILVARARTFQLSVDNQLEPKYYLTKTGDAGALTQVPNDIVEGRRIYALELGLDLGDATDLELFHFMMNQSAAGSASATIGCNVTAAFQLAEGTAGTLTISCGGTLSEAHPGVVIKSGKISIPAPPGGYFPTQYVMDVNHVTITTPV